MPIIAAAVKKNGIIYNLPKPARHSDILAYMRRCDISPRGAVQGFLTNCCEFVTRKEALEIAREAGQITKLVEGSVLTTEDMW